MKKKIADQQIDQGKMNMVLEVLGIGGGSDPKGNSTKFIENVENFNKFLNDFKTPEGGVNRMETLLDDAEDAVQEVEIREPVVARRLSSPQASHSPSPQSSPVLEVRLVMRYLRWLI